MSSPRYKYPRTPHLPWSPGRSADDVSWLDTSALVGCEVVVTEKMDGENTTLYREGLHARSVDSRHHPSRAWIKAFHAQWRHRIPPGWRFCGENLFAEHSIRYDSLPSYFMLFSIWDAHNRCLSWDDTCEWAALLDLACPTVRFRGLWAPAAIKALALDPRHTEGYVVRTTEGFHYDDFAKYVAKYVRANHVQTDEHWMFRPVVANGLAS